MKQVAFTHTVGKRQRKIVVVAVDGKMGAVKAITFGGAKMPLTRTKRWIINLRWPFIHRREATLGYKMVTNHSNY